MADKACDGGRVLEAPHDMAECASCGRLVRWDLQAHRLFGFGSCADRAPAAPLDVDPAPVPVDIAMNMTGGRCPSHPWRGLPCAICGEPRGLAVDPVPVPADVAQGVGALERTLAHLDDAVEDVRDAAALARTQLAALRARVQVGEGAS